MTPTLLALLTEKTSCHQILVKQNLSCPATPCTQTVLLHEWSSQNCHKENNVLAHAQLYFICTHKNTQWKKSYSELKMSSWATVKPALVPRLVGLLNQMPYYYERSDILVGEFIQIADHDTKISNSGGIGNFQEMVKLLLGL